MEEIPDSLYKEYVEMRRITRHFSNRMFPQTAESYTKLFDKERVNIHPDLTVKIPAIENEKIKPEGDYKYQVRDLRKNYESNLVKFYMGKGIPYDIATNIVSKQMAHRSVKMDQFHYFDYNVIMKQKKVIHPKDQIKREVQAKLT